MKGKRKVWFVEMKQNQRALCSIEYLKICIRAVYILSKDPEEENP